MSTYPPPPTQYGTPSGPSGPRAGFGPRLAAAFIDGIVTVVVPVVIIIIGAVSGSRGLLVLGYVLAFVFWIGYEVYFHGGPTGQTLGKRALQIRVVDFATGGPIGYGRAFLRFIGRWISGLFCYLGYLWMLWDKEKQCWHDKMANDVVVPVHAYPIR